MSEQYQNLAASTNTGTLDGSTNPITIVVKTGDGALFPATTNGPFRITVCNTPRGTPKTGHRWTAEKRPTG